MDSRVVGILGGGQLGRMIVEAANRLNIRTCVLDAEGSPAMQINAQGHGHVYGSFADAKAVRDLALKSDILTIEIEHVNVIALTDVQRETGIDIYPTPATIAIIQDKYLQKIHLVDHSIVVENFRQVERDKDSLAKVGRDYGYPFMLKARTQAYDGRGNYLVRYENEIDRALEELGSRTLYAEKFANFTKELAVMVVRQIDGTVSSYPTTETVHKENICHITYTPARVPDSIRERARSLAERAVASFDSAGTFGVEMFLLEDGEIVVNEIAPRPHNSGHYTIDACSTSQFESHIRAVLGLPLAPGFTSLRTPDTNAIMLNILGGDTEDSEMEICKRSLKVPGATIHLYGKASRKKRKMGHINIVAGSMRECEARLQEVLAPEVLSSKPAEISTRINTPLVSIIMGSDSDLPVMSKAADILNKFDIPFEVTIVSAHRTPERMITFANAASERGVRVIIAGAGGAAHLPGMVASMTTIPVIGVPVKASSLDGIDSLYSIVQMPRGVPTATVGINNATNAGLLAVRIISISDTDVVKGTTTRLLSQYTFENEKQVLNKADKLQEIGYEKYLENMKL